RDGRGIEAPAVALDRVELHARDRRGGPGLVVIDVAALVEQHLVAVLRLGADGKLVAHGAAHHVERRLLASEGGDPLLEPAKRRIVSEDVGPHLGLGHGAAHGGRGAGDGVAADVDRFGHASLAWRRTTSPPAPTPCRKPGPGWRLGGLSSLVRVREKALADGPFPGARLRDSPGGRALTHFGRVVSLRTANANNVPIEHAPGNPA